MKTLNLKEEACGKWNPRAARQLHMEINGLVLWILVQNGPPLSLPRHKPGTQQAQPQMFSCFQLVCSGKGPVVRAFVNTSGPLQTRPIVWTLASTRKGVSNIPCTAACCVVFTSSPCDFLCGDCEQSAGGLNSNHWCPAEAMHLLKVSKQLDVNGGAARWAEQQERVLCLVRMSEMLKWLHRCVYLSLRQILTHTNELSFLSYCWLHNGIDFLASTYPCERYMVLFLKT